jgi:hypothetical protein
MADDTPHAQSDPVNEYEREPVPEKARLGFTSFVGQYAGEHTAGTELMFGPLFVASGAGAFDLVVGLLLGNLLAVLSWTFLTTPIAKHARLTLYYQLGKICGRRLVTLYNLANGVMFCFLAAPLSRRPDHAALRQTLDAGVHGRLVCHRAHLDGSQTGGVGRAAGAPVVILRPFLA